MTVGSMRLRPATPGHTHHHLSYALADPDGRVAAVFTGGSMLYGTTGLVAPDDTVELATPNTAWWDAWSTGCPTTPCST